MHAISLASLLGRRDPRLGLTVSSSALTVLLFKLAVVVPTAAEERTPMTTRTRCRIASIAKL